MRRLLSVGVLALIVTGCSASVTTDVRITGPASAELSVSVGFTGAAVAALEKDPTLAGRIEQAFRSRGLEPVSRSRSRWSAEVTGAQLASTAPVTGVSAVTVRDYAVTVTLSDPTALRDAIAAAPDEAARPVMADNVWLIVKVHSPGPISDASGPVPAQVDGATATVRQRLSTFSAGTVTVQGSEKSSSRWPFLIGVLVVAVTAVVLWKTRRRPSPQPGPASWGWTPPR